MVYDLLSVLEGCCIFDEGVFMADSLLSAVSRGGPMSASGTTVAKKAEVEESEFEPIFQDAKKEIAPREGGSAENASALDKKPVEADHREEEPDKVNASDSGNQEDRVDGTKKSETVAEQVVGGAASQSVISSFLSQVVSHLDRTDELFAAFKDASSGDLVSALAKNAADTTGTLLSAFQEGNDHPLQASDGDGMSTLLFNRLSTNGMESVSQTALNKSSEGSPMFRLSLLQVNENQLLAQITNRLVQWKSDGQAITIQLKPEMLGYVSVKLLIQQQQVRVDIVTQNSLVKEILDKNHLVLGEALSQQGLAMGGFSVNVGDMGWQSMMARNMSVGERGFPPDDLVPELETAKWQTVQALYRDEGSAVDLYI